MALKPTLGRLKCIGLENILDLKSYVIVRRDELTVHKIEFNDGGSVKLAFTAQGKLVELSTKNTAQTFTTEGAIVIRARSAAENT